MEGVELGSLSDLVSETQGDSVLDQLEHMNSPAVPNNLMEGTESGSLYNQVSQTQQESFPGQLDQQAHVNSPAVPNNLMEGTQSGSLYNQVSQTQQESFPGKLGQQEHVNSPAVPNNKVEGTNSDSLSNQVSEIQQESFPGQLGQQEDMNLPTLTNNKMEGAECGGLSNQVSKTQEELIPRHISPQEHMNLPAVPSVSSCYVFKSLLQEYAQKVKLPNPTYNTIKEGPSHEPSFQSTVTVAGVTYDSLPGFFSRRDAEQSAAEVALKALANSGTMGECISQPVHDTGLCKNLLQAYAQKMNFAIPSYICLKDEKSGHFSCTVDIGGIKYIGGAARSKKEAELKAARTALLAIQCDPSVSSVNVNASSSAYTVVPSKKVSDSVARAQETPASLKPKKGHNKKRPRKRHNRDRGKNAKDNVNVDNEGQVAPEAIKSGVIVAEAIDTGFPPTREIHENKSDLNGGNESVGITSSSIQYSGGDFLERKATTLDFHPSPHGGSSLEYTPMPTS